MNNLSSYTNNLAIGLSAFCVVHCLASPLLIVLLPSLTALQLDSEAFHSWLLIGVIPSSLFSLLMGCKQHRFYRVLVIGLCGLLFLISAVFVDGFEHAELMEKVLTVIGASIVAFGHYLNFRLCQDHNQCDCRTHIHKQS
ncbi:MAG: putative membrane protein YfcA [Gammaproteobacteria bacterium]|jgi:uncharacterized membrane protein YfcA